jgi:hypothetical protein
MSDDDEHRRLDETGEFQPLQEDGEIPPIGGTPMDDGTERRPPAAADSDGTQVFAAEDQDATRVAPRAPQSDATSVLPAAAGDGTRTERDTRSTDNWADDGNEVWSARAGVRPRRPGYGDDSTSTDWALPDEEPHGKWWTPIAVGIVGLLLLSLLGWGIYLIVQSAGDGATPEVTASAAAPATTRPSSAPPATEPPAQPTSPLTTPGDVTVPALKGLSSEEASDALDRRGLNYRLRFVTSDSPAGTVIDSDPVEGRQVPADTVITLIIAAGPTASATPTPSASTGPSGADED